MTYKNLIIEIHERILTITLNRPEKLNALSKELFLELGDFLSMLSLEESKIRGLRLTGAGNKAFAAGADISQMNQMSVEQGRQFSDLAQKVTLLFENLAVPTIACVDGFALGGGCELAMSCDFIYATKKSIFAQPEVTLGLIPGFGGCVRLARYVGLSRAKELIYTGARLDAVEAKKLNLVTQVFDTKKDLMNGAKNTLDLIIKNSGSAVSEAKKAILASAGLSTEKALIREQEAFANAFGHPEKEIGVTAFLEKKPANFLSTR